MSIGTLIAEPLPMYLLCNARAALSKFSLAGICKHMHVACVCVCHVYVYAYVYVHVWAFANNTNVDVKRARQSAVKRRAHET